MDRLGLNSALCKTCKNLKITKPTEIQEKTIPLILKGLDLIGIAQTGSGKTACYCLPTLQRLSSDPYGVFGLVLLPTKELAIQVFEQFTAFAGPLGFRDRITIAIGGDSWLYQTKELTDRPYIVIGTPGRLLQHLCHPDVLRNFLNLSVIILDEADRLLSGTLQTEVEQILKKLPPNPLIPRQHLLFTATLTSPLEIFRYHLSKQRFAILNGNSIPELDFQIPSISSSTSESGFSTIPKQYIPVFINVNPTDLPLENLQQFYIFIPIHVKIVYLVHILSTEFRNQTGLIFTKTCQTAQILTTSLQLLDFSVTTLHSLLDHKRRVAHLSKFRSGRSELLVATDVASRGLDIPKVNFVINFDFPTSFEDYVHRVGRTARVGRKGISLSIICDKDKIENVHAVEERSGVKLKLFEVDEDETLKRLTEVTKKKNEAKSILFEQGFFDLAERTKNLKLKRQSQRNIKQKLISKK